MNYGPLGMIRALIETLLEALDPYPKKKGPSIHKSDESPPWRADSYEPLSLLSEEDQEEAILRGDKSLEDFTMSHVWPPEKQEDNNIVEVEQENAQEQNEDSENAESGENPEGSSESGELDSTSESSGTMEDAGQDNNSTSEDMGETDFAEGSDFGSGDFDGDDSGNDGNVG